MTDIVIKGLEGLQSLLDELPAKIELNIVRGGLRAAAKVIEAEAKRLCPVGDPSTENKQLYGGYAGALRDSIHVSMRTSKGTAKATIKAGGKIAYYAHMVEFGTARHWIKPLNRKSLFLAGLFKEAVDHPGAKKKPFMRPAIDGQADGAVDVMADYVRERIPKEVAKLK
jgi:HK97 gp10 family phage protein